MAGISFNTTKERRRLAKILAAKLDKADVSALLNDLLQEAIDRHFPIEVQATLLDLSDFPERETAAETADSANTPKSPGRGIRKKAA